jgi:hypothetical protein
MLALSTPSRSNLADTELRWIDEGDAHAAEKSVPHHDMRDGPARDSRTMLTKRYLGAVRGVSMRDVRIVAPRRTSCRRD